MYKLKRITNHHWYDFKHRSDVPKSILEEQFAWCESDTDFIKHKSWWYHLSQFMETTPGVAVMPDGQWSGVEVKLSDDRDQYQITTLLTVSA